jgi:hypothetical protein
MGGRAHAVHARLEARDDPEVAAAPAAQRPEQVGVAAGIDAAQPPVCRHHNEAGDVVGGQPEGARGEAVAAAEREAAEADRRARAAGHRATVAGERVHHLDHVRSRPDARAAGAAVDRDRAQTPQVDQDALAERRVAGVGVAARARGDADVMAIGPAQDRLDVAAVAHLHHRVRRRAVEAPVVDLRGAGVGGRAGADHGSPHAPRQLAQRARSGAARARGDRRIAGGHGEGLGCGRAERQRAGAQHQLAAGQAVHPTQVRRRTSPLAAARNAAPSTDEGSQGRSTSISIRPSPTW